MKRGAGEQQAGLDDLHPGGRGHAAEEHVDHHQRADDDHRHPVLEAEQQLDELAGADHLRDQVEGDHDQGARGREGADRGLLEAVGGHVGEGELAEVAQALRHQEGDHRPADQEADRVDQAVVAARHHRRRDTEEGGGRHVVAGDRQAVLEAGDAAAGGVEVGRRLGLGGRPLGDVERAEDEHAEHHDGRPVGGLLLGLAEVAARGNRHRGQQGEREAAQEFRVATDHLPLSSTISRVSWSNSEFARRT